MAIRFSVYRLLPGLIAVFLPIFIGAQVQTGMRGARNAGIYGAAWNPASMAYMESPWDLSLGSASLYLQNNYLFVRHASTQDLVRHPEQLISIVDTAALQRASSGALVQDFFGSRKNYFGVLHAQVQGPSGSIHVGRRHTIGFSIGVEALVSAYQLPGILDYPVISQLERNIPHPINPVQSSGMLWRTMAIPYCYHRQNADWAWSVGISPKLLTGYEAFFLRSSTSFNFTQLPHDSILISNGNWHFGFTQSLLQVGQGIMPHLIRNGSGLGFDLGFCLARMTEGATIRWRLGLSALNLGAVRFRQHAEQHQISFQENRVVLPADFPSRKLGPQVVSDASRAFLSDSTASLVSKQFSIGLPSAFSVQAVLYMGKYFSTSFMWMQRFSFSGIRLKTANVVTIMPQWEHKWWGISAPINLTDWQFLRMGLAIRAGYFYLGTDQLGRFSRLGRWSGSDAYLGIKIQGWRWKTALKLPHHKLPSHYGPNWWQRQRIKCYFG